MPIGKQKSARHLGYRVGIGMNQPDSIRERRSNSRQMFLSDLPKFAMHSFIAFIEPLVVLMSRVRSADKGRNDFCQLLISLLTDFLHLGEVVRIHLLQKSLKKTTIAKHSHIGHRARRQQTAQAIEHLRTQRGGIGSLGNRWLFGKSLLNMRC